MITAPSSASYAAIRLSRVRCSPSQRQPRREVRGVVPRLLEPELQRDRVPLDDPVAFGQLLGEGAQAALPDGLAGLGARGLVEEQHRHRGPCLQWVCTGQVQLLTAIRGRAC